jgi:hypothetical protein
MSKRVFKINSAVRIRRTYNCSGQKAIFADMWGNSEAFLCLDTKKNRKALAAELRSAAEALENVG